MKWNKLGRAALGATVSAALAFATACSRDYAVAYLYSTSAGTQTVGAFAIDYQTGVLTQIAGSPFSGVGRNPVTLVAHPSGKFIYVISHDDSTVTEFAVGTDGKLYGQHTANLTGSFGTSAAMDPAGNFLYVTYTYQSGYSTASPGPGGVTIIPIDNNSSDANYGAMGTPVDRKLGNNPVSVAVSATSTYFPSTKFVYIVDQEASPNATLLSFTQNTSTGALTAAGATTCNLTATPTTCKGYSAGTIPSSVVTDPTARYVYVADEYANQIISYSVSSAAAGSLTALVTSPTSTGSFPVNLTIDPRGKYLLVANYNANTVGSYTINTSDGSLGGTASLGNVTTATGPTCVTIDPALGVYVYTSNRLDNSISGAKMSANTGSLATVNNSPFPTSSLPSCVVSVASGNHAQSIVNP